jgi:hypothetical protein
MKPFYRVLIVFLAVLAVSSCRKDELLTDGSAKLDFSTDTVMFDTVFTSLGSTTRWLKVFNNNSRPVKISSIRLAGGAASTFRLNLDGISGKSFSNVEIPGKDSLFMFVEVTVNPNSATLPYIIQDSVIFETNGNFQDVDLVAFGQNANFIIADRVIQAGSSFIRYALLDTNLNSTITWNNTLPYVIWGGYAVVDSTQTFIIQPGTRIYFGNNAGIWVYRYGTIKVQGTQTDPVKFQGVRLETYYQKIPGQWDRIWINEGSTGNEINYAEIRNGFIGIQAEALLDTAPPRNVKITNTIIHNMSGFGIFTRYFNLQVKNSVITRSGQYATALTMGGAYEFRHTTIANFWNAGQRSTPSVYINDYAIDQNENPVHMPLQQADFYNCILWGNNDEELEVDYQFGPAAHNFRNLIIKTELDVTGPRFSNILKNISPSFVSFQDDDYQLGPTSPAINAGDPVWVDSDTQTDIRGINRVATPDLGAYEKE